MIRHYFVHFVRNLMRQKWFAFINLLGLTVSIACTTLIYLYVRHEQSYDSFHHNSERLYRINQTFIWSESSDQQFSRTGPGVALALKEELPEVEMITSLHTPGNFIINYTAPNKKVISFEEDRVFAADTNFFEVLNFPLVKGNTKGAFSAANTMVMTRSTAERYFQNDNPIGKLVQLDAENGETQTFEVIGVVEDVPENSTIQFDVLLSMKNFPVDKLHWSWVWTQLETFVLFRENTNMVTVREKLRHIPGKRAEETLKLAMGVTYDEYIKSGKKWELFLQPVESLHMPEHPVVGSFTDVGSIKIIYSAVGAAIFIVLLSCINFTNLSTAQFTKRLKEASVRKILGLGKKQLAVSYFAEALIFCFAALLIALVLTQMMLPQFNTLIGKELTLSLSSDLELTLMLIALTIIMAVVSSCYPAIFLTTFNPVQAIKGKLKTGKGGILFRNGLVVFQFAVSIVLIVCTAVVYQQLMYVSEKDLGFDKENLIEIEHVEAVANSQTFAKTMTSIPGAVRASLCTAIPPEVYGGDTFTAEGMNGQRFSLNYASGDENYIPTLGIKLTLGRNFDENNLHDKDRVLLNEAAVRRIGWTLDESVIGKKIDYYGNLFEVVGVMSDFNYWSLAASIEPMAIFHVSNAPMDYGKRRRIALRIQPQNPDAWDATLTALAQVWKQYAGDTPLQYEFIDESFAETFETQQKFGKGLTVISVLAILIAALGLLGMIIYSLEQRTKEIGIRKVSGAGMFDIMKLISVGYTKLIVLAFIAGAPLAWWIMTEWLNDFAYRITPSPWVFIIAGCGTLAIAALITSYHTIKAALTNPVDVLKDE